MLTPLQLANGNGRVGEDIEGGNDGAMTYLYFKGHIVPVVGRE